MKDHARYNGAQNAISWEQKRGQNIVIIVLQHLEKIILASWHD